MSEKQQILDGLEARGIEPSQFDVSVDYETRTGTIDYLVRYPGGTLSSYEDGPEGVVEKVANDVLTTREETKDALGSIGVAADDLPDPSVFADLTSGYNLVDNLWDDKRIFSTGGGGTQTLTLYETGDREEILTSLEFDSSKSYDLAEAITEARPKVLESLTSSVWSTNSEIREEQQDRQTRRELRNQLDSAVESAGYDDDEWNTGARADGTLILQDPETNRTRTIEAGDDLDSTVDSFGGDSDVQPESDDGSEQGGSGDGLDRRAIGAGLIVAAAAAYGVTQR